MADQNFQQAIQNPTAGAAPTDNLMGATWGGNLARFMDVNYRNQATQGAFGALNSGMAQRAQNDATAAENARQQHIQDIKDQMQHIKDMQDPSKYSIQKASDGGLRYLDPSGKQVDLATYTQNTGADPATILKNSDNLLDKQFVNDYSNMQKIVNAYASGDSKFFQDMQKNDPDTYSRISKMGPQELMAQFKQAYPNVYSSGNDNNNSQYGNPVSYVNNVINKPQQKGGTLSNILHAIHL